MTPCGLHPLGGAEVPGIRQFPFPRSQDQTPCAHNAPPRALGPLAAGCPQSCPGLPGARLQP